MFKLKIINKPKMIKMKCNIEFPDVVLANFQEKEVTPTKEMQQIIADQQYDGLSKVVVNAIPDEYIIPNGNINIIENGTYDVTDKINAIVNIPEKKLGSKIITENGTYKASDDNLDGYSEVEVTTSGVDINEYFTPTIQGGVGHSWRDSFIKFRSPLIVEGINGYYMFNDYAFDTAPELIGAEKLTNASEMFYGSNRLKYVQDFNTSNVIYMSSMFQYSQNLVTVPKLNASKVMSVTNMFGNCSNLTNLGGLENLGQAYDTTKSANYSSYKLDLSTNNKLTHDSLMNVINNLYDIKSKGCNPQSLVLGSTNLAKLTSEEVAIATEKGWTVS